jgi:hypothetical protein
MATLQSAREAIRNIPPTELADLAYCRRWADLADMARHRSLTPTRQVLIGEGRGEHSNATRVKFFFLHLFT